MKTQYTPGEWKSENMKDWPFKPQITASIPHDGYTIAILDWSWSSGDKCLEDTLQHGSNKTVQANAKLIAAAPDMFTALMIAKAHLEYAIEFGAGAGGETKAIMIIDRAIKKATE